MTKHHYLTQKFDFYSSFLNNCSKFFQIIIVWFSCTKQFAGNSYSVSLLNQGTLMGLLFTICLVCKLTRNNIYSVLLRSIRFPPWRQSLLLVNTCRQWAACNWGGHCKTGWRSRPGRAPDTRRTCSRHPPARRLSGNPTAPPGSTTSFPIWTTRPCSTSTAVLWFFLVASTFFCTLVTFLYESVTLYLEGTEHFRYVCRGLVETERAVGENQQPADNCQSWNGKHEGGITVVNFVLAQQLYF